MDHTRFDALTRYLATSGSRRHLLGGLIAGALGVAGLDRAHARTCTAVESVCREHATCCSGLCGPKDATGRRRCQCRTITDCPAPGQCHDVACLRGICATTVRHGQVCDDGNACTSGKTCQPNGRCGGGTIATCTALDQCHDAGTCDPATGICSNPAKVCSAQDQCHDAGTCDLGTGQCSDPLASNGTACTDGNALCLSGACCTTGHEIVHGGCFKITNSSGSGCGCGGQWAGSVFGSGNYLCAIQGTGTCTSNDQCPTGQACWTGPNVCIRPCPE